MTREQNHLFLDVPGLAENRPSVLSGDNLLVYIDGAIDQGSYQGFVHEVHDTRVKLAFSDKLLRRLTKLFPILP